MAPACGEIHNILQPSAQRFHSLFQESITKLQYIVSFSSTSLSRFEHYSTPSTTITKIQNHKTTRKLNTTIATNKNDIDCVWTI